MKFQNNRIPKYTKSLITSEHTSFLLSIALRYYVLIKKQLQLLTTSQQPNSSIYLSCLRQGELQKVQLQSSISLIHLNLSIHQQRGIYKYHPFTSWKITFVRIASTLLANYLRLNHQDSSTLNFSLPGK